MSHYPDGYNGVDRSSRSALFECDAGHVWATIVHYECGAVSVERPECPHCGMDGAYSDEDAENAEATKGRCSECGDWVDLDELSDDGVCSECNEDNGEAVLQ